MACSCLLSSSWLRGLLHPLSFLVVSFDSSDQVLRDLKPSILSMLHHLSDFSVCYWIADDSLIGLVMAIASKPLIQQVFYCLNVFFRLKDTESVHKCRFSSLHAFFYLISYQPNFNLKSIYFKPKSLNASPMGFWGFGVLEFT